MSSAAPGVAAASGDRREEKIARVAPHRGVLRRLPAGCVSPGQPRGAWATLRVRRGSARRWLFSAGRDATLCSAGGAPRWGCRLRSSCLSGTSPPRASVLPGLRCHGRRCLLVLAAAAGAFRERCPLQRQAVPALPFPCSSSPWLEACPLPARISLRNRPVSSDLKFLHVAPECFESQPATVETPLECLQCPQQLPFKVSLSFLLETACSRVFLAELVWAMWFICPGAMVYTGLQPQHLDSCAYGLTPDLLSRLQRSFPHA